MDLRARRVSPVFKVLQEAMELPARKVLPGQLDSQGAAGASRSARDRTAPTGHKARLDRRVLEVPISERSAQRGPRGCPPSAQGAAGTGRCTRHRRPSGCTRHPRSQWNTRCRRGTRCAGRIGVAVRPEHKVSPVVLDWHKVRRAQLEAVRPERKVSPVRMVRKAVRRVPRVRMARKAAQGSAGSQGATGSGAGKVRPVDKACKVR